MILALKNKLSLSLSLRSPLRNANYSKLIFNIWVTQYLSETKEYVLDHSEVE